MLQNEGNIRGPYGGNETSRFIELALIVDNALYEAFDQNVTEIDRRYRNIVKFVNGVSFRF